MRHFFITGLPRTRTSWLANLFTDRTSVCWHDALNDGLEPEAVRRRFTSIADWQAGVRYIGDSDSGLICHAAEVQAMYPDGVWVFVRRPRPAAEASFRKFFADHNPYALPGLEKVDIGQVFDGLEQREAAALKTVKLKMEIDFSALDDLNRLQEMWNWCVPGLEWDSLRVRLLQKLQVNPHPYKTKLKRHV